MYNLFISHSWAYSDQYDRLVSLLNAAPNFDYQDHLRPGSQCGAEGHAVGTRRKLECPRRYLR